MGWARWEKRRISHLTHFAPCPSPGARRSDRTLASDRASSGAGVRTPRLLNALQGVCGLQRPHSDLTATSQRPHRDLTATSQRPRSDLTATSQRPHRDPTATSHSAFSSRRSSIDPPTRHPQSLSPHFPRDPPRDLSAEIPPPPSLPPTRVSLTCVAPPPSLCSCYRTWRTISSRTWRHSPASSFSTGVVFLSLTHSILPMCHTPTLPLISPS